jgi:hypothetical protein
MTRSGRSREPIAWALPVFKAAGKRPIAVLTIKTPSPNVPDLKKTRPQTKIITPQHIFS